jgi:reductive dehalogenase
MKLFSNRRRPVHLGPYPLEGLPRAFEPQAAEVIATSKRRNPPAAGLASTARRYRDALLGSEQIPVASAKAPHPITPVACSNEIKAACYFLDAAAVGVCELRTTDDSPDIGDGRFAVVFLVEHRREPEPANLASGWVAGAAQECTALRGAEIAAVVAGYIKQWGWDARVYVEGTASFDLDELARCAGLVEPRGGGPVAPFIGGRFATAAVITSLPLQPDRPLAPGGSLMGALTRLRYWLGIGAGVSGLERARLRRRPMHLGRYPMERIRRRDAPTTLVFDDEIPRVPQRAQFFRRADCGDLGDKAQRERQRFANKHPFAYAMTPLSAAMTPMQDGEVAAAPASGLDDPAANARAVKALGYYLNADMVGICEAKPYAWFSHDMQGEAVTPHHRFAIAMLIDQGHDTIEGASGDDWISGSQSLRAYMRGAEIAGVMAAHIRSLGYSARAQSHTDTEVLHLPLLLQSGLGELSRIGELVLNPYLGPRSKSVVLTTDMPLAIDRPVDFGLQDTCSKCLKCARECPCNAISYKDKVIFNGYEMWKPDVERCARYRITNPKGSACGRCMKVCPYTNEGLLTHRAFLWAALHLPFTRRWIARLDDVIRHGTRNPAKKWWSDLERLPDGTVQAAKGANTRELSLDKRSLVDTQDIAYYPASVMPAPRDTSPQPIDRAAALAMENEMETPADALLRRTRGESAPAHHRPWYGRED